MTKNVLDFARTGGSRHRSIAGEGRGRGRDFTCGAPPGPTRGGGGGGPRSGPPRTVGSEREELGSGDPWRSRVGLPPRSDSSSLSSFFFLVLPFVSVTFALD